MNAWYWYLTGVITTACGLSAAINAFMIMGVIKITVRNPYKTKVHVVYDWSDHSGEISRVS